MNNQRYARRAKRNQVVVPSITNMINEIMNTPIGNVGSNRSTTPAVNVRQSDDQYQIDMAIPGYTKEDIKMEVADNKLVISSNRTSSDESTYKLREFNYGEFNRSFRLPKDVDQSNISASVTNGVLQISIAKKAEAAPITIDIK